MPVDIKGNRTVKGVTSLSCASVTTEILGNDSQTVIKSICYRYTDLILAANKSANQMAREAPGFNFYLLVTASVNCGKNSHPNNKEFCSGPILDIKGLKQFERFVQQSIIH